MAKSAPQHKEKVAAQVEERLIPRSRKAKTRLEWIQLYRRFLKTEEHRIKMAHRTGAGGLQVARQRADLLDIVLHNLFTEALHATDNGNSSSERTKNPYPITLVACGGYGRGTLNPGSDVDVLFLCPGATASLPRDTREFVSEILTMLFDVGFKVGHATRSIKDCIIQANKDNQTKTALIESRLITGDEDLFNDFRQRFYKDCIQGKERQFLQIRTADLKKRHQKHGQTVYLQEPNIKECCGGLRDYQNIIWVIYVKYGVLDLKSLVEKKLLTKAAYKAMEKAYDFLMRVRNELHYAEQPYTDILTLRLQGVVATNLAYPQRTMLRRIEAFMRDYYKHAKAIYSHSTSLMQSFELLQDEERNGIVGFLARRGTRREEFDGFYSRGGLIYPDHKQIFEEDRHRLMRVFQHTQQRHLRLSPPLRKLFKQNYSLIDKSFLYHKINRQTFESILSRKGDVARTLREMHRIGFLGKYLPEFGALDCLVQHEFFHRYTADEHTLRCIDVLDSLSDSSDPKTAFFQRLFHELEDPYVMYVALLLHDAGRAENTRFHTDSSAVLALKVCNRLQIRGPRRRLLLFLIDNHLTFWKMATTMNIEDPETISEFANIMQNRRYMEALLLMTYADSNGTNDEAWSSWKESLMLQLYRSTCAWFEDQKAFEQGLSDAKSELREKVSSKLQATHSEEIKAHFDHMPERYFMFRGSDEVIRHVKLFRKFIRHCTSKDNIQSLHPALKWVHFPESGYSQLELCSWDRKFLLATAAGALASQRINILSADFFTRDDNVVLDIFRVCTTEFEPVTDAKAQKAVARHLNQVLDTSKDFSALSDEIPESTRKGDELVQKFPTRVYVTNDWNTHYTVLEVQALDRLGLLHDVFTAIAKLDIEVAHARINTEKGAAIDTFYLTDELGNSLSDKELLKSLQEMVESSIEPD